MDVAGAVSGPRFGVQRFGLGLRVYRVQGVSLRGRAGAKRTQTRIPTCGPAVAPYRTESSVACFRFGAFALLSLGFGFRVGLASGPK